MAGERYQVLLSRTPWPVLILGGVLAGATDTLFIIFLLIGIVDVFAGGQAGIGLAEILRRLLPFSLLVGAGIGGIGALSEKRKMKKESADESIEIPLIMGVIAFFLIVLFTLLNLLTTRLDLSWALALVGIVILPFVFALPVGRFYLYWHETWLFIINKVGGSLALQRQIFEERLEEEFSRIRRYGGKFCLLFIGIDNKEELEAMVGPQSINRIQQEMLGSLQKNMRKSDIFSAWEKDKICGLLIDTPEENSPVALKRIGDLIANHTFRVKDVRVKVLPAFGLSAYNKAMVSKEELIKMARQQLRENMKPKEK